ncbi:hypothetical protein ABE450_000547 [Clostridium perfringens]|mgnify:CR=1 FL=1|uniref:hypothetical protein n=1 Tax=Clostridium perfringens TaxID=1502 RepID=UPI001CAFC6BB|nr:hypothetical protein [Clostridium perfringens]EJT6154774.1 hypothetical protein [Clostridium perfringens]MDK0577622.1 hypothetical protein [Clostridium perfringens]MDK0580565.1 hypothetical protein [Clostridium perfringens]MDK0667758.1 hypothetical protein [Clostridium perfringens]MDM0627278.1 hypothetical protein [Clostridium perfringens]
MFGYQRLCEITGITKNEMRALINLNGLPSKGLIKIVPKKRYENTYYHFTYDLKDESKILDILGLEVKNQVRFLKESFN